MQNIRCTAFDVMITEMHEGIHAHMIPDDYEKRFAEKIDLTKHK